MGIKLPQAYMLFTTIRYVNDPTSQIQLRTHINFLKNPKENPCLLPTSQKIKTIFDFFLKIVFVVASALVGDLQCGKVPSTLLAGESMKELENERQLQQSNTERRLKGGGAAIDSNNSDCGGSADKSICSNNNNHNNNNSKKKKTRTTFTGHQIFELEKQFELKKYLSSSERAEIAVQLKVTETQVGK